MAYETAVKKLFALGHELHKPQKFDLAHMRTLAARLGDPQRRVPSVLVAGTNGKGSVSATLASIIEAAGYQVGLYTSPHLVRVNERIRINGENISDAEFGEIHDRVEAAAQALVAEGALDRHPSFFEMMTAIAFEFFASAGVDIMVLECGLGGRLDATNIADPFISVISDIALDHQQFLGNTLREIAIEKTGILRANGFMVTLPQHPEANEAIGARSMELGAKAVSAAKYVPNVSPSGVAKQSAEFDRLRPNTSQMGEFVRSRYFLDVMGEDILIESPLIGRHQLRNIALAISAAETLNQCGFTIGAQDIANGIRETRWAGRFQFVPRPLGAGDSQPDLLLDVAHNPAGAWALRSALSENFGGRPITFVFGGMRDKALAEMAQILFPLAQRVVLAVPRENPRAATIEELRAAASPTGADLIDGGNVEGAIQLARKQAEPNSLVVITGSIYVVGEAMESLFAHGNG